MVPPFEALEPVTVRPSTTAPGLIVNVTISTKLIGPATFVVTPLLLVVE